MSLRKKSDWSEWGWDEANSQYYRTRYDSRGNRLYDTRPAQAVAQETPRSGTGADTVNPYASDDTPRSYYGSNAYQYETTTAKVDSLSERLENTSIGSRGSPVVAYSPSYATTTISTSGSQGTISTGQISGAQPIDVPMSLARSTPSGSRAYSSSAPASTTSHKGKAVDTNPGYFPEETTGFIQGSYEERQAANYGTRPGPIGGNQYYPSTSETASSSAYYGQPSSSEQQSADVGGSGADTPKSIHKAIRGTNGDNEKLDTIKPQNGEHLHQSNDIQDSRSTSRSLSSLVFKVLWSEPEGETRQDATDVTRYTLNETKYGQKVHSTIRRFVIVAADRGHCQCLPILTYQRQGATKYGINRDDHAIIYIGEPPSAEINVEEGMTRSPIQMLPKSHRDKLEPKSRINYAKIYTVEHNVKILFIGRIAPTSGKQFMLDFDDTWYNKRQLHYS